MGDRQETTAMKGETMSETIERAELRVSPHFVQVAGEEGFYDAQRGYQIEARIPVALPRGRHGDAHYTYQGVFSTEAEADAELERLCGAPSNGFHADIDTESDPQWLFTGASY